MRVSFNYYGATTLQYSAEYIAFRDRVVADQGTISSAAKTQQALTYVAGNAALHPVQWLDSRFGVGTNSPPKWYCLLSAATDATQTIYGNTQLGIDGTLGVPVWNNGAFLGGNFPTLGPADDYTVGMYFYEPSAGNQGFLWGNRYGEPTGNGWTLFSTFAFQAYAYGYNGQIILDYAALQNAWRWLWVVKSANVVTVYDQSNTALGSVQAEYVLGLPFGIGGGTDSTGVSGGLRYRTLVRFATALTAAQRAAIQAI